MQHEKLKNIVIPECFYRECSDFTAFKVTEFPIKIFGDDEKCFMQSSRIIKMFGEQK